LVLVCAARLDTVILSAFLVFPKLDPEPVPVHPLIFRDPANAPVLSSGL
jgi:hypothetical protein